MTRATRGLERLRKLAAELELTMECDCNLARFKPERATGHTIVCRIHKRALSVSQGREQTQDVK